MSKQSAKAFLERCEKDKSFITLLKSAKNTEELKAIFKKENIHFTKEEFREVYKESYHKELTDAELNNIVAAGKGVDKPKPFESRTAVWFEA